MNTNHGKATEFMKLLNTFWNKVCLVIQYRLPQICRAIIISASEYYY